MHSPFPHQPASFGAPSRPEARKEAVGRATTWQRSKCASFRHRMAKAHAATDNSHRTSGNPLCNGIASGLNTVGPQTLRALQVPFRICFQMLSNGPTVTTRGKLQEISRRRRDKEGGKGGDNKRRRVLLYSPFEMDWCSRCEEPFDPSRVKQSEHCRSLSGSASRCSAVGQRSHMVEAEHSSVPHRGRRGQEIPLLQALLKTLSKHATVDLEPLIEREIAMCEHTTSRDQSQIITSAIDGESLHMLCGPSLPSVLSSEAARSKMQTPSHGHDHHA